MAGVLAVLAVPLTVWAEDATHEPEKQSKLQVAGYASLVYSHDNQEDLGFRRDYTQTDDWNRSGTFLPDSRLGLQLTYRPQQQWEMATQLTVKDRGQGASAGVEWAFLGWHSSEHWTVRGGRLPLDLFMMSDYQGLGYAYLPVRPPTEFYGPSPAGHLDGVDLAWQQPQQDSFWRIKLQLGQVKPRMASQVLGDPEMRANNVVVLSVNHETPTWRWRFGHVRGNLSGTSVGPMLASLGGGAAAGIPNVSADAQRMQDILGSNHFDFRYTSLGVSYDDGTWLAQSEISKIGGTSQVLPLGERGYLLFGRRLAAFTPYAIWGRARADTPAFQTQVDWTGYGGGNAMRDQLASFINITHQSSRTFSLGVRWDLHSQTALTWQWDTTRIDPQGYAPWSVLESQRGSGARVNQVSVALNHVF